MQRLTSFFFMCLMFLVSHAGYTNNHFRPSSSPTLPDDSLLNKITDIDQRLRVFTQKDTLGGYSTPRKIETSSYFKLDNNSSMVQRDRAGLIVLPFEYDPFLSYINFSDTVILGSEMLPVVFNGQMLPRKLSFSNSQILLTPPVETILLDRDSIVALDLYEYKHANNKNYNLIDKQSTLYTELWQARRVQFIRKQYYVSHPERIKSNALQYASMPTLQQEAAERNPFKELISAEQVIKIEGPSIAKTKIQQKFWKKWGEHKLDVSQKRYSKNWNPKTNDNFQVNNYHKFNAIYRKGKISFDHWLEWRLNIQYNSLPELEIKPGDKDVRTSFLINDDWVRSYNRLGLDAFIKKWSYIYTLDIKTPIFSKRAQDNKNKKLSRIFSPLEANFGIGAGYKYGWQSKKTKGRSLNLSIDATPISINMKHVGSGKVYEHNKYGVVYEKGDKKEGERRYTKTEFGSTLNMTIDYKINSYTNIFSRSKYFTNYERSYLECENTVNFKLNRFLSTSLYLYLKYDDSVERDKRDSYWGYFSYNEVLGFGLSYNW